MRKVLLTRFIILITSTFVICSTFYTSNCYAVGEDKAGEDKAAEDYKNNESVKVEDKVEDSKKNKKNKKNKQDNKKQLNAFISYDLKSPFSITPNLGLKLALDLNYPNSSIKKLRLSGYGHVYYDIIDSGAWKVCALGGGRYNLLGGDSTPYLGASLKYALNEKVNLSWQFKASNLNVYEVENDFSISYVWNQYISPELSVGSHKSVSRARLGIGMSL
jgi:hypothetical protein